MTYRIVRLDSFMDTFKNSNHTNQVRVYIFQVANEYISINIELMVLVREEQCWDILVRKIGNFQC